MTRDSQGVLLRAVANHLYRLWSHPNERESQFHRGLPLLDHLPRHGSRPPGASYSHPYPLLKDVSWRTWCDLTRIVDKYAVNRMPKLYKASWTYVIDNADKHKAFVYCRAEAIWDLAGELLRELHSAVVKKPGKMTYKGRKITSFEPGLWDEGMIEEAGDTASHRLEVAWAIARERVRRYDHPKGFAGLLGDAFVLGEAAEVPPTEADHKIL